MLIEDPLVSCESEKTILTMEEITEKLLVLKFDKQVEDVVSKLYEGRFSNKKFTKISY